MIQALKGGVINPNKNKGVQKTYSNILDATARRGSRIGVIVKENKNIISGRKWKNVPSRCRLCFRP